MEINSALENLAREVPGYHINIFGCDACMMATYEMAAMLSHHSIDYYVASEELEPGTGWDYTGWLDMLKQDPDLSDEELCGGIIESFIEQGLNNDPDDYLTLSAVKLSAMGELEASMEKFASTMSGQIENGNISAIRRGRSRMYTFGSFADGSWDMVDLGAALDAYAQFDAETATRAKRSLSEAVILSRQTDNLDTCSGLSVLIPQDTTESFEEYREGFDLSGIIPNWVDFVCGYVDQLQGGSFHISASSACQFEDSSSFSDASFSSSSFWSSLLWDDEEECYTDEYYEEDEYTIGDDDEGFTAVLSQEDLAYLDYVEGMLLMDISDEETTAYVDFGLVFPAGGTEGRIVGANAGYDENGLPIRSTTRLKPGDEIIPVYTLYVDVEGEEDLQETEFEGDKIIWQEGMTVTYEDLSDETDPQEMLFCFIFNDIFGEDSMSDMIAFEL